MFTYKIGETYTTEMGRLLILGIKEGRNHYPAYVVMNEDGDKLTIECEQFFRICYDEA